MFASLLCSQCENLRPPRAEPPTTTTTRSAPRSTLTRSTTHSHAQRPTPPSPQPPRGDLLLGGGWLERGSERQEVISEQDVDHRP